MGDDEAIHGKAATTGILSELQRLPGRQMSGGQGNARGSHLAKDFPHHRLYLPSFVEDRDAFVARVCPKGGHGGGIGEPVHMIGR